MKSVRTLLTGLFVLCAALASFCPTQAVAEHKHKHEKFNLIHTAELKKMMADSSHKMAIYDANNQDTRTKDGIIPGAVLLSSFNSYDVAKELPAVKGTHLVFYCANPKCTASHAAAERAVAAGYTNVSVLSDGIQGWVKAGEKADHMKS
ncbi:MAG: rhodanese-like domain-containing protein [Deltaproteobacteria bacterium]|nr:rhodanese-like domain-containing protein [Deltaproteobacteria bacterium]